jgi:hypothetical protein
MSRATSRAAFDHMISSGKLHGQLAELQELVVKHGEGTIAEIVAGTKWAKNLNLTRARFIDLRERGLISEVGQRECSVTGRTALEFSPTLRDEPLVVKRDRKPTRKLMAKLLAELCDVVETDPDEVDETGALELVKQARKLAAAV